MKKRKYKCVEGTIRRIELWNPRMSDSTEEQSYNKNKIHEKNTI